MNSSKREPEKISPQQNKHFYSTVTYFLNIIHCIILIIPPILFSLNQNIIGKYFKPYIKYILLFYALLPLHWVFFDDACIFTKLSVMFGDYSDAETTSQFSEENMMWLYGPLLKLFGWQFNSVGMNKIVTLHSILNILFIWTLL